MHPGCFRHSPEHFDPVTVDGTQIQATTSSKLLGLTINNTLTWNDHVRSLVKKAARKIYFLVQLKRARVPAEDLVAYYCACIRSSLDYACPVFPQEHTILLSRKRANKGMKRVKSLAMGAFHSTKNSGNSG